MGSWQQKVLRACFLVVTSFILGCLPVSNNHESIAEFYGFPVYPELTHLCGKRVYMTGGAPGHITWDAFASESSPSTVVEHYLSKLGDGGSTEENEEGTWRLPTGVERPSRELDIYPVGQPGPHEECEKKPPLGSRSIVLFSRMP